MPLYARGAKGQWLFPFDAVLPMVGFDAYFGTTSFGQKYLRMISGEIIEQSDSGFGIFRYWVREAYQI